MYLGLVEKSSIILKKKKDKNHSSQDRLHYDVKKHIV